ncbi:MAG: AAA family ATPase [Egibacteraceae bacterium]
MPPTDMFDRAWEWQALTRFAADPAGGATLGVVRGRRRQGKSFLLHALCEALGGLYYEAYQGQEAEILRHFGAKLAEFTGAPGRVAFDSWEDAIGALLDLAREEPVLVVLDEFAYLAAATPELPSILQGAFGPRSGRRQRSRTRLILCSSALTFMSRLLSGDAPLRGRASLELPVHPFDYQQAAEFWGLSRDPELAFRVYAVVGGTPAYRREFVRGDAPADLGDFDSWVVRSVLDPAVPLFFEGRYLLAEDPGTGEIRAKALYHSVLGAIAEGNTTRGAIASYLGRRSPDIGHPLSVLEDAGLIRKEEDALKRGKPRYEIAEPIIRFYHAVMRPWWGQLERPGSAARVWADVQGTFRAAVLGPAFEEVCRAWTAHVTAPRGGHVVHVGHTVLTDRGKRTTHRVDVIAFGERHSNGRRRVLVLGEAKYGQVMGAKHLERLRRVRDLLATRDDLDLEGCRLACFSAAGFAPGLDQQQDALLVDLPRLYGEA